MARRSRYILPGVAVHIIQRGVNRVPCFRAEADYLVYLSHLRQLSPRHDCAVHAYCLMTNHVHLLVTPGAADSCTRLMRDIGRRYVPYFNRRHERTGTLWEGRFRSCIAESARYVLACYRYIELNPVRAKMVDHPGDYPWSSYAGNAGALADAFMVEHPEFAALALETSKRHAAYTALFAERMDETQLQAIRDATNSGYPMASEQFKNRVMAPLGWNTGPRKRGPAAILTLTPNSTTSCDPDPELVF